ncbi:MAG: hypothetical protein AB3P25_02860 [Candidatus Liberibacter psyllaurous]
MQFNTISAGYAKTLASFARVIIFFATILSSFATILSSYTIENFSDTLNRNQYHSFFAAIFS